MVKKKVTAVTQKSPTKIGKHLSHWLGGKLNPYDRGIIKSFVSDPGNLIDLNANSPDFIFNVIDLVLEKLSDQDNRWRHFQSLDHEPSWKKYLILKKSVRKYLDRSSSPSRGNNSCENFSPETFGEQIEDPQSSPAITVSQDSPPHDENPI